MKYSSFLLLLIVFAFSLKSAIANTVECERTTNSIKGFSSYSAMESWFPKNVTLNSADFKRKSMGSTSLIASYYEGEVSVTLLKNGKLAAKLADKAGYNSTPTYFYKCNKNSEIVLTEIQNAANKTNSVSNSSSNQSNSKPPLAYANVPLCEIATRNNEWRDYGNYKKFVTEAKRRGLNCGVTTTNTSTATASQDAKIKELKAQLEAERLAREKAELEAQKLVQASATQIGRAHV